MQIQAMDPSEVSANLDAAWSPEWRKIINSFLEFQRNQRGVRPATVKAYRSVLSRFALHVSPANAPIGIDELTVSCVDSFIIQCANPLGRTYVQQAASRLRPFLRYLVLLGHVPTELAAQVPRPRVYRLAGLPRDVEPGDLRRILRTVRRREPCGKRAYAILMLFASYGLRVSDVAELRLDDIHWREASIVIRVKKTGRPLVLPLVDGVGDALADYVQHGRPRSDNRGVFLSLHKPFHPLSKRRLSGIVRSAICLAGVDRHGVGSYSFRHGFATRLVRNGVALDTVADCLGHASTATTLIYTKLAVEDLRSVSLDPSAVLP